MSQTIHETIIMNHHDETTSSSEREQLRATFKKYSVCFKLIPHRIFGKNYQTPISL